jgi:uncharacterized protein YecA (UPF0149 family)
MIFTEFFDKYRMDRVDTFLEKANRKAARLIKPTKVVTRRNANLKTGRNEPCPCGSGKKYKKCCIN